MMFPMFFFLFLLFQTQRVYVIQVIREEPHFCPLAQANLFVS